MKDSKDIKNVDLYIAQRLKKFRIDAGMSQKKLAKCAGISFQQVQKYESIKNKISLARLFEFSQIFRISVASFFDGLKNREVKCEFVNKSFEIAEDLYSVAQIKEYLPLMRAYSKIEDESIRKNIMNLVQNISETESENEKKINYELHEI